MSEVPCADGACPIPAAEAAGGRTALEVALVIFALAVGGFGIGTGEFAIMGLLPNIAAEFAVTTPQAGYSISAYAIGVVVGAPIIAVLSARLARRTLLLGLMAIFALGNVASAMAPDFGSFVLLRFLTGLPHGAYFGVAALVAASMVARNRRTQAVGYVMLGLTSATLVGTPVATWVGQELTWRLLFASVGVIGLITAVLIWIFLPADKAPAGSSALRELGAFRRKQVWFTLGIGAVGFGGLFCVFSYIASTATEVAGMSPAQVPILMALFGAGMISGTTIGSRLADRALMATIAGSLIWTGLVGLLLYATATSAVMLSLCVFLVGCSVAIGPALQTRLMDVAADAQTLAAALNHSAFNIANALGAWLGGIAISLGYGYASTGWVGAILAVFGLCVLALSLASDRRARHA
ncbi:MFS transporter [Methylobrevis pamukkalensis]|uniref:Inner membrane transport protein YdhP n=1 Tax=Methylobrevis pamukkalensis TaxID=1439726 RepID=A0A1E3H1D6_9HYPH|nr:MFS transporter [Methylobrevis pamukkalensis]ODN70130.1 Inner membrane transport protein YdhP [Methylobrevis pamukkalensis]